METNRDGSSYVFYGLDWDTAFFGCLCAKAVLFQPLTSDSWEVLKDKFRDYEFISIENRNSEPSNAQLIGRYSSAFLADVNIQFMKKPGGLSGKPKNTTVIRALEFDKTLADLAIFRFSKFTEDPEMKKRGGERVYSQWVINSFGNTDKYFVLSRDEKEEINGFLLFSYKDDACFIELIAVSGAAARSGTGSSLFLAAEYEASKNGCAALKVGTQLRNTGAVNFYFKNGCAMTGCHQTYHLWNL